MHSAETGVPLKRGGLHSPSPRPRYADCDRRPIELRETLQLQMGSMHEERMVGWSTKPRSRTPISLVVIFAIDLSVLATAARCRRSASFINPATTAAAQRAGYP